MLPMTPERLVEATDPHADYVLFDRLNYLKNVRKIFRRHRLTDALIDDYAAQTRSKLLHLLQDKARIV